MVINLIYHFQSSQNQDGEFQPARYKVVYFFSEQGFLEKEMLIELSKTIPEANHQQLTFLSLDDLKSFAQRVSEELGANEVRMISVQDYNIGIDGAKDKASFQSIFTKFGEALINEQAVKKKGLLSRFFS